MANQNFGFSRGCGAALILALAVSLSLMVDAAPGLPMQECYEEWSGGSKRSHMPFLCWLAQYQRAKALAASDAAPVAVDKDDDIIDEGKNSFKSETHFVPWDQGSSRSGQVSDGEGHKSKGHHSPQHQVPNTYLRLSSEAMAKRIQNNATLRLLAQQLLANRKNILNLAVPSERMLLPRLY